MLSRTPMAILQRLTVPAPAGLTLAAAASVAALLGVLLHARAERLRELPPARLPIACRSGYVITLERGSNRLLGVPVTGGKSRTLTPAFGAPGSLRAAQLTDLGVVIRSEEPVAPRPDAPSPRFRFAFGGVRTRLWHTRLDGQPARELLPELRMTQAAAAGEHCYWLDTPGAPSEHRRTLRVTPLRGGSTQVIALGLQPFTRLEPLGPGVTWTASRPGSGRQDRYLALPPDFQVRAVLDCYGTAELLGERLYWIDHRPASDPSGLSLPVRRLLCATLESDRRQELLTLTGSSVWEDRGHLLGVHGGRLYALLYRRRTKSGEPEKPRLCEVRESAIREVAPLRPEVRFTWLEDGCLYYTAEEVRENWLDWSPTGLQGQHSQGLYRHRLPG